MSLDFELTVPGVAHYYHGAVDRIGGREVAVLHGGLYVVRFGPRVAAVAEREGRQTMGQIGVWFRPNYARRIDQLPMAHVHPDLLEWGGFVADSRRQGQLAVQGAAASGRGPVTGNSGPLSGARAGQRIGPDTDARVGDSNRGDPSPE